LDVFGDVRKRAAKAMMTKSMLTRLMIYQAEGLPTDQLDYNCWMNCIKDVVVVEWIG